jgi:hypothetical protein
MDTTAVRDEQEVFNGHLSTAERSVKTIAMNQGKQTCHTAETTLIEENDLTNRSVIMNRSVILIFLHHEISLSLSGNQKHMRVSVPLNHLDFIEN